MSNAQEAFYHALASALAAPQSGIGPAATRLGTLGLGQRFLDIVKRVFASIDVSQLTKEEFLAAVSAAYDTFIAPMFLSSPMGLIISPLVKSLVMSLASKFYDNQKKPAA